MKWFSAVKSLPEKEKMVLGVTEQGQVRETYLSSHDSWAELWKNKSKVISNNIIGWSPLPKPSEEELNKLIEGHKSCRSSDNFIEWLSAEKNPPERGLIVLGVNDQGQVCEACFNFYNEWRVLWKNKTNISNNIIGWSMMPKPSEEEFESLIKEYKSCQMKGSLI